MLVLPIQDCQCPSTLIIVRHPFVLDARAPEPSFTRLIGAASRSTGFGWPFIPTRTPAAIASSVAASSAADSISTVRSVSDEGDAAADVDPDRRGHDGSIGEQDATDRHAVARLGVGHERDVGRANGRFHWFVACSRALPSTFRAQLLIRTRQGLRNDGEGGDVDRRGRARCLGCLGGHDG
jgi:hypothetical protein